MALENSIWDFIVLNLGLIIGITVILALLIFLFIWIKIRRARKKIPDKVIKEVEYEKNVRQDERNKLHQAIFHDEEPFAIDGNKPTNTTTDKTSGRFGSDNEEIRRAEQRVKELERELEELRREESSDGGISTSDESEGIIEQPSGVQLSSSNNTPINRPKPKTRFKLHKPTDL